MKITISGLEGKNIFRTPSLLNHVAAKQETSP
jgi:hypothetical protein